MKVKVRVIEDGTRVKIRQPGPGERGEWVVIWRVIGSDLNNPAYDIRSLRTGRVRVLRQDRLRVLRPRRNA